MKKLLVAALLFTAGFSMSAHAGLISGPITFDGGKSVDLQGLEWLPVTYTAGLSRDDVERGFSDVTKEWGKGGWRYATRNETERLLGSLWGGRYNGWSYDNFAGALTFMEIFGVTYKSGQDFFLSAMLFGADGDCSGGTSQTCSAEVGTWLNYPTDTYANDKNSNWSYTQSYTVGQAGMGWFMDEYGANMGLTTKQRTVSSALNNPYSGSLLVRSVDTPVATVSSPAALSLFAFGLCGLLLRRRKIAA